MRDGATANSTPQTATGHKPKEVLIPLDNHCEALGLSSSIRDRITMTPVQSIQEALSIALLPVQESQ
jgi:predicted ATP-dependent protease